MGGLGKKAGIVEENMVQLSASIIAFNEERNILRCIKSLRGICDEIVVVDSHSQDRTVEIARECGARVIQHPFQGHIEQKNFALAQCRFDYILSLDADEALSEELRESILAAKANFSHQGYRFNRLTCYAGHWVRHCGWYPDTKLRLVRKNTARWEGVNPHDILRLKSGSKGFFLKGDLLHYSYDSISSHIEQTNKFSSIAAKAIFGRGGRGSYLDITLRPWLKFLRDYIWKRGFLDGRYGFVICCINGLATFLKYAKLRELARGKNI